ncbi:MAG: M23 family metallopeptidase [Verrucomicrobiota bacterium]|nr:MAG: M23 family metallopeptidase [Verrucomicrobiota bacterium]
MAGVVVLPVEKLPKIATTVTAKSEDKKAISPAQVDAVAEFLKDYSLYVQPTESGRALSALFGLIRENGTKFHEGIDFKSFLKDKTGAPLDVVHAFLPGKVAYVNTAPGHSSYGRYVILEHEDFLTLYAHLQSVDVKIGDTVSAGGRLGILGTSSSCIAIPNSRAHVHFEIDFRLGDETHFAQWYRRNYKDQNFHGMYNGINLVGVDPRQIVECFQKKQSLVTYFRDMKEAATVLVTSASIPEFIKKNAKLFAPGVDLTHPVQAWKIKFTWYGLPFHWEPIVPQATLPKSQSPSVSLPVSSAKVQLLSYRTSLLRSAVLRDVLQERKSTKGAEVILGTRILNNLSKIGF